MENYSAQTKRLLTAAGWLLLRRGEGDHEIWHDPRTGKKVTVDDAMKSRHTANDILKRAGLPKAF